MIDHRRLSHSALFLAALLILTLLPSRPLLFNQVRAQSPLKAVIVELKSDPVVVAKARAEAAGRPFDAETYRQQVIAEQQQFLQRLAAAGVTYKISSVSAPNGPVTPTIEFRFSYVYNGLGLQVPEAAIAAIEQLPEVQSVHPDEEVKLHLNRAVDYVRATKVFGTPPRLTQFDTLNTGGLEGEGVNIAVLDTGVDWSHEMFGGDPTPPQFGAAPAIAAAGPNKKVIYYMNFTAAAAADDFGHGTHVAGDAAGYRGYAPGPDGIPLTADDVAVHGAAPQAKIMAYKVLTGVGSGVGTSIIAAIEDAVQPRTITGQPKPVAHIINLSLGGAGGPDSPNSVACDNAVLAGAVCVASAGNSGPGEQTIGQPAAGRRVITIGANIDPGSGPNSVDVVGGGRTGMKAFILDGSAPLNADITKNYVFCGLADTPDQVPDSVNGRIALIARGSTVDGGAAGTGLFSNKAALVAAKGAVAAIIYNNVAGELTSATVRKSTIPVVGLNKDNGEYLKSLIGSTEFGAVSAQQVRLNKAQLFEPAMADFSSRGPVTGFGQVKPDVTAPGVAILSATVAVGGAQTSGGTMFDPTRYISANGTSFSGPIAAGVAALIRQKHPNWTPSMIRAALVNTATNLRNLDGSPAPAGFNSINEQGGGLVDAFAAVNTTALMGVGQPAPAGQPQGRTFGIFVQPSAGNPDFTPSYSFGAVPIANLEGTATLAQTVTIYDVTNGNGAGTYQLAINPVANVPASGFEVKTTDLGGNAISAVTVPAGGAASFNLVTVVNGQAVPINPTQPQWYLMAARTDGKQTLRMPFYYRAVTPVVSMAQAVMGNTTGAEVSGTPPIDINGSYQIAWSYPAASNPKPAKFRVQESRDNGATWTTLADVPGSQTTFNLTGKTNGAYQYRVTGLFAVQYGLLAGLASDTATIQVNRRVEAEVTNLIQTAIANVNLTGGIFSFDQILKNKSTATTVLPPLQFTITAIQSASGSVRAINADNGGNGVEAPASFAYSNSVGADRQLTPGEISGARHLKFSDPASEMFQFTAVIKGHYPDPAHAASAQSASESEALTAGDLRSFELKLRFIVSPTRRLVRVMGER